MHSYMLESQQRIEHAPCERIFAVYNRGRSLVRILLHWWAYGAAIMLVCSSALAGVRHTAAPHRPVWWIAVTAEQYTGPFRRIETATRYCAEVHSQPLEHPNHGRCEVKPLIHP